MLFVLLILVFSAVAANRNGRDYQKSGPGFCSVMNGIVYECDGTERPLSDNERRLMDQDRQNSWNGNGNGWNGPSWNNGQSIGSEITNIGSPGRKGQNNAPGFGNPGKSRGNGQKNNGNSIGIISTGNGDSTNGNGTPGRKGQIGQNNSPGWTSSFGNGWDSQGSDWDQRTSDFDKYVEARTREMDQLFGQRTGRAQRLEVQARFYSPCRTCDKGPKVIRTPDGKNSWDP